MTNEATKLLRGIVTAWDAQTRFDVETSVLEYMNAARAYLSQAPAAEAPQWVSVRDRMPAAQMVLMHIPNSHAGPIAYGWYDGLNTRRWMIPLAGSTPWGAVSDEVTHWLPIKAIPLPDAAPSAAPAPVQPGGVLADETRAYLSQAPAAEAPTRDEILAQHGIWFGGRSVTAPSPVPATEPTLEPLCRNCGQAMKAEWYGGHQRAVEEVEAEFGPLSGPQAETGAVVAGQAKAPE